MFGTGNDDDTQKDDAVMPAADDTATPSDEMTSEAPVEAAPEAEPMPEAETPVVEEAPSGDSPEEKPVE